MGELEALRVRDEVLQAMYWMRAEGLADAPSTAELARFLAVPAATLAPYRSALPPRGTWRRPEPAGA
jgi:hypothetical protein